MPHLSYDIRQQNKIHLSRIDSSLKFTVYQQDYTLIFDCIYSKRNVVRRTLEIQTLKHINNSMGYRA